MFCRVNVKAVFVDSKRNKLMKYASENKNYNKQNCSKRIKSYQNRKMSRLSKETNQIDEVVDV